MLSPPLLALCLLSAAPASSSAPPAALVDALLSNDEASWRKAALELSFAGPQGARAVAARGEKLKERHHAVQTYLMLALLESATPEDLRALPALKNFWEPAVAEARQWAQRPIPFRRPGPRLQPPTRTEQRTPEQQEAEKNLRALQRLQSFLVPLYLERLRSAEPDAALDAVLWLERQEVWSARAEVERLANDPKRAADDVAARSARRYLDLWRKASGAPMGQRLKPRLAAMVVFEEAGEADALWRGLAQEAPAAAQAKTAAEFWSRAGPSFAAFWRAAAAPAEQRAPAMAAWDDRNRGYSLSFSEGTVSHRLVVSGPAGATATVTDAGSGKPVAQGKLPLSVATVPPAGCRITARIEGRALEVQVPSQPGRVTAVELLSPASPAGPGASQQR